MKKFAKLLLVFILTIVITGCNSNNLENVKYSDVEKLIKEKKSFILLVSQTGCSHCIEYAPTFKKVLEDNNLTACELNITNESKNSYNKFVKKFNFEGTPTTMFFIKGKEVFSSRIVGATSQSSLTKTLKRLDYIK